MADGLKVIPTALLISEMREDGGISGCAGKVLAFSEGDVLTLRVLVALGKTKINDVDVVLGRLVAADHEVVGLNVPMDDPLFVHFLNTMDLR